MLLSSLCSAPMLSIANSPRFGFMIAATVLFACVAKGFGSRRIVRDAVRAGSEIANVEHVDFDQSTTDGFADQAHLQRAFRKFVAATPGQYKG